MIVLAACASRLDWFVLKRQDARPYPVGFDDESGRFATRGDAELRKSRCQMALHGRLGDEQSIRYLLVREAHHYHGKNLLLACCQPRLGYGFPKKSRDRELPRADSPHGHPELSLKLVVHHQTLRTRGERVTDVAPARHADDENGGHIWQRLCKVAEPARFARPEPFRDSDNRIAAYHSGPRQVSLRLDSSHNLETTTLKNLLYSIPRNPTLAENGHA